MEAFGRVAAGLAVVTVIGIGGYFAIKEFGWEDTLETLGIVEVTTLLKAPDSQCARAREQSTEDEAVICISDRVWLRTYIEKCANGEESGLAYVDVDGVLTGAGTCPRNQRAPARARVDAPIPRDYRIADLVESIRTGP